MCTAYELGKRGGSFPERVTAEAISRLNELGPDRIVRPTLEAPVILPDGSLEVMSWGFRRTFAAKSKSGKPVKRTIVNSRDDKLDGRMWRESFESRRCLIPAASFFEWVSRRGKKVPLAFERPDRSWIWIAGIWEDSGKNRKQFSMITTPPNPTVEPVHDRMPAVLPEDGINRYLDGDTVKMSPSPVLLEFREALNFLKTGEKSSERL